MYNSDDDDHRKNCRTIISLYPSYLQKLNALFEKSLSFEQMVEEYVIRNEKAIINIFESGELEREEKEDVKESGWDCVTKIMLYYFRKYIPNVLCTSLIWVIGEENRRIPFSQYTVFKMFTFKSSQTIFQNFIHIFEQIVKYAPVSVHCLIKMTQIVSDHYYKSTLSIKLLSTIYHVLKQINSLSFMTPSLYFDGTNHGGLKVLLTENKWPFEQGMSLCMWIKILDSKKANIMKIVTEDKKELIVKQLNGELVVQCKQNKTKSQIVLDSRRVCELPINRVLKLQVKLKPKDVGFFKDPQYAVDIIVDNCRHDNIEVKVPHFSNSQYVTELNLLTEFVGIFYSCVISGRYKTEFPKELLKEQDVNRYVEEGNQKIISMVSGSRYYKGILLNYNDSQNNHVCFECKSVLTSSSSLKILLGNEQFMIPLVYILISVMQMNKQENLQGEEVIKQVIEDYVLNTNEVNQINNKYLLYLFYFLQLTNYPLTQSTFKRILNYNHHIINKYASRYTLNEVSESDYNPASKLQLLFYLQGQWKKEWNKIQSKKEWWSPSWFTYQHNLQFDFSSYEYKENGPDSWVSWKVNNMVTNDFCHPLLEPQFKINEQSIFTKYGDEYIKKGCMGEYFDENLGLLERSIIIYGLKKVSKSSFNLIKRKLMRVQNGKQKSRVRIKMLEKSGQQMNLECCWISLLSIVKGIIRMNQNYLIFSSKHNSNEFDHMCIKGWKNKEFVYFILESKDIKLIKKRRYNQSMNGIQIKMKSGNHQLFYFYNLDADSFVKYYESRIYIEPQPYDLYLKSKQPLRWIDKQISNYQYLQWLNDISGRSYHDITQYPFLPWIFVSNQPKYEIRKEYFRKLQKNMGSFGPEERVNHFLQKFSSINETQIFSEYHFGTHYSSSAIICNYLIRLQPYASGSRALQSGKFDCADRIFYSYYGSWVNATNSPTDIRELIPEIYFLPEMFINKNNFDFGLTQEKQTISNVELPKWANSNPYLFCFKLRLSFESKFVSEHIKNWIDLIYGCKQKGKAAVDSMNIYFPLTYENAINIEKVIDPEERLSMETQIAHFGQNPAQVIGSLNHPQKKLMKEKWQGKLLGDGGELTIQRCSLERLKSKDKFQFGSVFEDKNCVLNIKFIEEQTFFVLRRYQYVIFKILKQKEGFMSKQKQVEYSLQTERVKMDYQNIPNYVPFAHAKHKIVVVGGFYNGIVQIIFYDEPKFNDTIQLDLGTVTAIQYCQEYNYLYLGDIYGTLCVYKIINSQQMLQFQEMNRWKSHNKRINHIHINYEANLLLTSGQDGIVKIWNLYEQQFYRLLQNPSNGPISFSILTRCPLYGVLFYSQDNNTIYCFSINGQFLSKLEESTGFIYNMYVLADSNYCDSLVYLNRNREVMINSIPELGLKKKVRLKKDEFKISCFESNRRMAMVGSQDGTIQIIDPGLF